MRWGSSDSPPPIEVRCARCDVSFPVETKTCIHCGGPTSPADAPTPLVTSTEAGDVEPGAVVIERREYADDYDLARDAERARGPFGLGDFGAEAEAYEQDAERDAPPPSALRAIMGSLGGLVWIVLFVLFSLARSCGEGP